MGGGRGRITGTFGAWLSIGVAAALLLFVTPGATRVAAQQEPAGAAAIQWGGSTEIKPAQPGTAAKGERTRREFAPGKTNEAGGSRPATASNGPPAITAERPAEPPRIEPKKRGAGRSTVRAIPLSAGAPEVLDVKLEGDERRALLTIALSAPIEPSARSLSAPTRVILDLPETRFRLPPGAGAQGQGLVTGFRFGMIEAGKSRIVLDTAAPARMVRSEVSLDGADGAFQLEVEIAQVSEAELAGLEMVEAALHLAPVVGVEADSAPAAEAQLVIVIDPGHGGIDPGTAGAKVAEKDLVLAVARQLSQQLAAKGKYKIVLTRPSDVFVSLDRRLQISQRAHADLFVSLHADSIGARDQAKAVRGATIYTLSEQASDDLTRRKVDQENASDLLAGLPATLAADDGVKGILVDLMRRESLGFSHDFRRVLASELKSRVPLGRDAMRSGPFKVLRQPGAPAVLVELGYLSNEEDERMMLTADWQAKMAAGLVQAIERQFQGGKPGGR